MEVLEGVHLVDNLSMTGPSATSKVNVCLLVDGSKITVVDTGPPAAEEKILEYAESIGFGPSAFKRIIITHHHHDHLGGLAGLVQRTGAEVWAHRDDADFIDGSAARPAMKLPREVVQAVVPGAGEEERAALEKRQRSAAMSTEPVPVDVRVSGGEELGLLGGCRIVHTPGHTPGHLCLYLPEKSLLIAGDLVRVVNGKLVGPIPGFTKDLEQAMDSVRLVSQLEFENMFGYHGDYWAGGASAAVSSLL